ncbi:YVTN family beta-propeller repeat-containing protein [Verrucomicrobiaceae bacterium N1E253]|uniref:YVTN family beta-propeller repeat-containing protein n=1 Tax=Oceaniferula marina TaxID=2748318 RepID=A0A851GKL0_9BACT|nr:YVTN family beta-propeller repeat-containing protein [Oceaniferula marina]NWK54704.1 YVTN family beta-propeller repeat-containing protein [Oceaniferula marina]
MMIQTTYAQASCRFLLLLSIMAIPAMMLGSATAAPPRSPADLELSEDKETLYVAEHTGKSVAWVETRTRKLMKRVALPAEVTGITRHQQKLYVTSKDQLGAVHELNASSGEILRTLKVGQGARAPIVNSQRNELYVCNYFMNTVSVIDIDTFKESKRIPVLRMPNATGITKDGQTLYVANLLPNGASNVEHTAAKVSLIDCKTHKVIKHIELANGSNALRDITLSPDGHFVFVTHSLARFLVPTTQLDRGWINTNAFSIINTKTQELYATILLDDISQGAAGPWGIDISSDQKHIFVAHSGTHEISVIDIPGLIKKIEETEIREDLEYNLSIMSDIRKRIKVPGNGPRAILSHGPGVWTAQYFSDDLTYVDLRKGTVSPNILNFPMNPSIKISQARKGEIIFNDATYCFQQWLSCNACHTEEARMDGLNWDLLNDGIGNPKNAKSLLFSHVTPPAMITGIRPKAEVAVRAGVRHIQFASATEDQYEALDAYLKSLKPEPSPYLVNGELSDAAKRGEKTFKSPSKGACIVCHNGPYFTDMQKHDMKNAGPADRTSVWDTPTLREVWRTAPYLHDGRSATIKEVLVKENHGGAADKLDKKQIDDLVEYVLSL